MPLRIFFQIVAPVCFLFPNILPAAAQSGSGLHRYDAQIERFSENGQKDSFLLLSGEKCRLARQADSLALWGWTQFDIHLMFADDYAEALRRLDAAWENRWREPVNTDECWPFLEIQATRGWYLFNMNKVWQSVQVYEDAARWYERFRSPDFDAVSYVYKPLGNHYTRLGDNEKALAVFQKALNEGGDNESLSGLYCNMGIAYWNQGDLSAAETQYRQGLMLTGISDAKRGLLLGRLAETRLDRGQTAQARQTAAEALSLLRNLTPGDRNTRGFRARARRVAGLASISLMRYGEAGKLLDGALADDRAAYGDHSRETGKDYIARSRLFLAQGRALQALEEANRALNAVLPQFKPEKPEENPGADSFYEEITIAEALESKAAAAELLFEKNNETRWLSLALNCYELAWQSENRLRKVYQYSSSKLNLQKIARSRETAAMNVARRLFEKTGLAPHLEKAFAIAERSKATLLLEALHDNLVRQRLSGSDARFSQITALRQSLSYYEKNLLLDAASDNVAQWRAEADALTSQISALERALAAAYPNLAGLAVAPVSARPGTDELGTSEALIEYFAGDTFVDVFIFFKDSPAVWHRLTKDADLQSLVNEFLSYFNHAGAMLNNPSSYLQKAFALWQKIVPLEAGGAQRLTIVPDGFLNFIPFEALVTAAPRAGVSLRTAAYLIRSQEVRYAWSLAVLRRQDALKSSDADHLLAFAPGFLKGERGLAPLRGGSAEWHSAGWWHTNEHTGSKAVLQRFLEEAGRHRIIHLSTHAFADTLPRIELYDQPLLLPDIYALELHADLVVLSACQTGLGREQRGEGVMSLARAFAQSGAACVVSSLWAVNDRSTALLLDLFYRNAGKGMSVGAALRQAKLAYLNDAKLGAAMQSPYFWAGLATVGSDRAIGRSGLKMSLFWLLPAGLIAVFIFIFYQNFARKRHLQRKNR